MRSLANNSSAPDLNAGAFTKYGATADEFESKTESVVQNGDFGDGESNSEANQGFDAFGQRGGG